MKIAHVLTIATVTLLLGAGPAVAQVLAPPQGMLNLSASASAEVMQDLLTVVLGTSQEGGDAARVQQQLTQTLDAALATAKQAAQPGRLDVHTGSFSLHPRYVSKPDSAPRIDGWQGTAELVLEGRDMKAIGELAGRIPGMTVSRVSYALSREARERVESELAAQAIARYRAKASEYARGFGYGGYTIADVQVSSTEASHPVMPMMRAKAMSVADAALPIEAGKGQVTVSVGGSVQMTAR